MNTCHNNPKKTLTTKEKKINLKQKLCYICKKGFSTDDDTLKALKLKELKPKETTPLEYYIYFINGRAEIRCGKRSKKIKSDLGHIKQGPTYYKSPEQLNTIESIFMNQEKKMFNYLMIMLKVCLKILTNQNKEQDLKY